MGAMTSKDKGLPFWLSNRLMIALYTLMAACILAQVILATLYGPSSNKASKAAQGEPVDEPFERKRGQADGRWLELHKEYAKEARTTTQRPDVVFFGDSITLGWVNSPVWEQITKRFESVLNFGIGGDRTQHLLWRITNGELDFAHRPRCSVLMIGTNNLDSDLPQLIAKAALKTADIIAKATGTTVLLVGIPPRSKYKDNAIRKKADELNEILASSTPTKNKVKFIPFPDVLTKDGVFTREFTVDFVHLSNNAYQKLAEKIIPEISTCVVHSKPHDRER